MTGPESKPPGGDPGSVGPARSERSSRRYSRQWPFLTVVGGVGAGLAVVASHHFRSGSVLIAAALVAGAVLRLVLPERDAGMLVVRGRGWDVLTLSGLGVLIAVAAVVVPSR